MAEFNELFLPVEEVAIPEHRFGLISESGFLVEPETLAVLAPGSAGVSGSKQYVETREPGEKLYAIRTTVEAGSCAYRGA
jgi:hypothetical protein